MYRHYNILRAHAPLHWAGFVISLVSVPDNVDQFTANRPTVDIIALIRSVWGLEVRRLGAHGHTNLHTKRVFLTDNSHNTICARFCGLRVALTLSDHLIVQQCPYIYSIYFINTRVVCLVNCVCFLLSAGTLLIYGRG